MWQIFLDRRPVVDTLRKKPWCRDWSPGAPRLAKSLRPDRAIVGDTHWVATAPSLIAFQILNLLIADAHIILCGAGVLVLVAPGPVRAVDVTVANWNGNYVASTQPFQRTYTSTTGQSTIAYSDSQQLNPTIGAN